MKRKLLSVFLCLCMITMLLPAMAFAEEPTVSVWDGSSVATAYESGDGTEANPYEIATAEQFAYFAEQIKADAGADAYYILTSDLDMTAESWYPIGCTWDEYNAGHSFYGNLNGNGHCVTYEIDVPFDSIAETTYRNCGIGLFGISEAAISNLHVDGTITMSKRDNLSYYGGICGLYAGNMENCFSDVNITITENASTNYSEIGGLVGEIQGGTVKNCAFTGQIHHATTGGAYIGGISGYIRSGSIVACKNEGALSGSERSAIGGIVGTGWSNGADEMIIEDCYNMGNITQASNNQVYNNYAGGIAGNMMMENTSSAQLIGCYSGGNITANDTVSSSAICPSLLLYGREGAFYTVKNCYYLTGTDDNSSKAADLNEIYEKLSVSAQEGVWVQDANGVPRLYWELIVNPVPEATFTVTFATDYGTAPASMTVTEGTVITLPELEDDGDYVLVGWWILDSSSDFGFYSVGEAYEVSRNVTFVAEWDEIVTLTTPFTTTVELGDSGVPGETVFTLEVVALNVLEEGAEYLNDITVSASVTTNGKGDYDGTMTFTGPSGQLWDMLIQGVYVQQVDDGKENWTYDAAVWYLILAGEPEVSALTSTYDTVRGYEVQIFQAICEETEYGPVYDLDWENMDWDAPEAKMLFTNTYTAHVYTLEHNETEHWDECGCGDVQNREAHQYGEWMVTKEATETESGEKEHTCTVCGYTETVEIEKLPHIHDYTLEHNETEHWDECGCGDVQNREAHQYGEWMVTKEATETESGEKEHTCTVCGYTETVEIEKLPAAEIKPDTGTGTDNTDTNAQSPQTGDHSNIVLWFSLMLVAGAALTGTAVYTHKKKRSR